MIELGGSSESAAQDLWRMCARDILFWVNTFVWTYDPRKKPHSSLPFITFKEFQDETLLSLVDAIETGNDALVEKSRDMGASWLCLLVFMWYWHFHPGKTFLVASRNEDLVDKTDDPDSLFWKMDFVLKNEPWWLVPVFERTRLHFLNVENGTTIDGASTTSDTARGGRRTGVLLDEFGSVKEAEDIIAATADVTPCRIFNSTPKGQDNAFYKQRQREDIRLLRLHWTLHPEKRRGLYTTNDAGLLKRLDNYPYPADYKFILDGKMRSEWYDRQCKRHHHPQQVAQELDIDYLGSAYLFFDAGGIAVYKRDFCKRSFFRGDLLYNKDTGAPLGFKESDDGKLKLWLMLSATDSLPMIGHAEFGIGIDIAHGTGASNSCLSVGNLRTGEKVAEFADSRIPPHKFAVLAVAVAKLFNNAIMVWEAQGAGAIFGRCVLELGYRNLWYRRNEKSLSKKTSDTPGWYSTEENKLALLGDYRKALESATFINRSYEALDECLKFVYMADGKVAHQDSNQRDGDPSGARANHGDRTIADALLNLLFSELKTTQQTDEEPEPEVGSFLWRRQQAQKAQRKELVW